jgi:hypothetical protein
LPGGSIRYILVQGREPNCEVSVSTEGLVEAIKGLFGLMWNAEEQADTTQLGQVAIITEGLTGYRV